ncbi:hypothetical protein J2847_006251 [Azospirillum agricola]|uniref:glycosyltransferase family protein n=1 Tax=Azospirillum agricola TaxID=1720247 RepID=UPI001AEA791F|nr:hypothetical protein [Azospirillum agricola]MBP2232916.1 hypothetical protein [Azospirillum agricola]
MGSGLRLALHNPFPPEAPWAERELALRMSIALEGMGWEHRIVNSVEALEAFAPDAALCLHPQAVPKMTAIPSLGCHWNPPVIFGDDPVSLRNGLSHDAFLTAAPALERQLRDSLWGTGRRFVTSPIFPSSQGWALEPALNSGSRFFYIGSNWDGRRFPALLQTLARHRMLALHGQEDRWKHLADAFIRSLPFDGRSVIETAHACGMGLCLHLPAHFEIGIPNMRVFELCAAGALIVADRHPFIVENFGDTVLYVDMELGEELVAEQILAHGNWARACLAAGREMAREAQAIFLKNLSLERLFAPLPDLLGELQGCVGPRAGRISDRCSPEPLPISVVVPIGTGGVASAQERLVALEAQMVLPAEVIVAGPGAETLAGTPTAAGGIPRRVIEQPAGCPEGSSLWAGALAARQGWVAWLPEGALPFPEHLASLHAAATMWPDATVIRGDVLEPDEVKPSTHTDACVMRPWRLAEETPAHPAGLLVRREQLNPLLRQDPQLGPAAAWLLAQRLTTERGIARSDRATIRARGQSALPPEELERLKHFASLKPRSIPTAVSAPKASSIPWTGVSDLNSQSVAALPRLLGPDDFARLPPSRPILIYGASRGGRLLQLELIKWERITVAGFLDSHHEGEAWGLPVRRPETLRNEEIADAVIVVANQYVSDSVKRINRLFPNLEGTITIYNAYPYIYSHCKAENEAFHQAG